MKNLTKHFISTALLVCTAFALPANARTVEGVIKGAECHLYGKFCGQNANDVQQEFEKEYVLVTDNAYYLLDLIPQNEIKRASNQTVRITGHVDGQRIAVTSLDSTQNGQAQNLWNWEDYKLDLYGV